MTDTFDYAGLAHVIHNTWRRSSQSAADYLRTRIEAAFVPVEQRDKAEDLLYQRTNEYIEATARAEAAEARNKVLEEALRELIEQCHDSEKELTEEHYGTHYSGESLPLCNARAALGGEHGR